MLRPYSQNVIARSVSDDAISLMGLGDCHAAFGGSQ